MEPMDLKFSTGNWQPRIAPTSDLHRRIDTGEKQLNALNIDNRQFSIMQDRPNSGLSVVVAEKSTGAILSSFPAESVLRLLARVQSDRDKSGDSLAEPAPLSLSPAEPEMTTILIVEDDNAVRDIMCEILRAEGFFVLSANGGREALQLTRRYPTSIELVMTDLVMPDMNGLQLVEKLREANAGFKVVYMSGYGAHRDVDFGHCDPSIPILQKPFRAAELIRQVYLALGTHSTERSPVARPERDTQEDQKSSGGTGAEWGNFTGRP
jgi:CheY-like chemotaxis protein